MRCWEWQMYSEIKVTRLYCGEQSIFSHLRQLFSARHLISNHFFHLNIHRGEAMSYCLYPHLCSAWMLSQIQANRWSVLNADSLFVCFAVSQWLKLGQHWSLETLWSQTPINPLRCTSLPGCPKTVHDHNSCLTILYPSSIIKMVPGDTKDLECTSNVCVMLLLMV